MVGHNAACVEHEAGKHHAVGRVVAPGVVVRTGNPQREVNERLEALLELGLLGRVEVVVGTARLAASAKPSASAPTVPPSAKTPSHSASTPEPRSAMGTSTNSLPLFFTVIVREVVDRVALEVLRAIGRLFVVRGDPYEGVRIPRVVHVHFRLAREVYVDSIPLGKNEVATLVVPHHAFAPEVPVNLVPFMSMVTVVDLGMVMVSPTQLAFIVRYRSPYAYSLRSLFASFAEEASATPDLAVP